MRTMLVCTAAALAVLLPTATAASGSAFIRHTFPAAPPHAVSPAGTMSVAFPPDWKVTTTWGETALRGPAPTAADAVHRSVHWELEPLLMKPGTTLAEVRRTMVGWTGRPVWGKDTPINEKIGDAYVKLPVGTVWRLTTSGRTAAGEERLYERIYLLHRGTVTQLHGNRPRELFLRFSVGCRAIECATHNAQLAQVMRSIRIAG